MATIKEIATLANVSMATVSRVLNKDKQIVVSDLVKNQIFTIAHELGYVPPKFRRIPLENGITIGVADWHIIRPDRTNQKLSDFSNMAKRFCKTPVKFVPVCFAQDISVDGIIALGNFTEEEVNFLESKSCFILFLDSNQCGYQYDRILIDHNEGIKRMIRYFIDEKHYSSIGYIGGIFESQNIVIGKTRSSSFRELLKEEGCYNAESFLVGDMTSKNSYQLVKKMIQDHVLPRALLIGNDEIVEEVVTALEEEDIFIPDEIEIIVYKDIETLLSHNTTCSSIQVYTDFMWENAIKVLLERISGKRTETLTLTFPSKLVMNK